MGNISLHLWNHDTFERNTYIQKNYYLRNAISNDASMMIKNLETSAANYHVAWSILTDRYEAILV